MKGRSINSGLLSLNSSKEPFRGGGCLIKFTIHINGGRPAHSRFILLSHDACTFHLKSPIVPLDSGWGDWSKPIHLENEAGQVWRTRSEGGSYQESPPDRPHLTPLLDLRAPCLQQDARSYEWITRIVRLAVYGALLITNGRNTS